MAIIFGVKKFHMYLYGRESKFTLATDHQPLTRIFGPKNNIPTLAAARMQRWALILSGYQYDIVYRRGIDNANADMLSRLPVGTPDSADEEEHYIFHSVVEDLPITVKEISRATSKDSVLSKAYELTLTGWPGHVEKENPLFPYFVRREELSIEDGCLLWGRRVVIPSVLRDGVLMELHECHP